MAETGRSVCVRGLPTDVERERLEDKLLIHFLRERNGGGEISSVTVKAADPCATITFEDSRVALNVGSHRPHVLEVDGRMYELSLSFPWQESLHLNRVILDMSVTIDCNHLPLGEETIKTLTEKSPGLGVHYIKPQRHCTLKGPYSKVNDVVSHLKELLVDFEPQSEEHLLFAQEHDRVHLHQRGKDKPPDQPYGLHLSGDVSLDQESRYPSPKVNSIKLSQAQTRSDEKTDWVDAVEVEALSVIMEADVFAYLCSKSEEYRSILQNHGVHVVDVTSTGVTTLYLQYNAKLKTGAKAEKHMSLARKELSQLYQQVEGNLRRDQIPRSALNLHGDQTTAFKNLESLLPKVLLSFDHTHVYIVGESSEVSQAKQILLFGSPDENLRAKQEITSPSSASNSYSSISESEVKQVAGASSESSTMTPKMRISDAERRVRTGEEYKLAARFKNSDMGLMGFSPVERGRTRERQELTKGINTFTQASNSGPKLSTNSSLETTGTVNSDQARASQVSAFKVTSVNNVEEDILFQKMEPLSNKGSETNSVSCTSRVTPAYKAPLRTPVDATTGLEKLGKTTVESTTASTSTLKRANSFSGRPLPKQEAQKTGISEKSCLATDSFRRPRSGSLSSRMSVEALPSSTVSRAVTVPTMMWSYIKEAYHGKLNSLISDLKVSENHEEMYKTTVILKGSASSKVEECQSELQKLVDMIGVDFYLQNLHLVDLGGTEGSDIFKECCLNICSHFRKIVLKQVKEAIFLMGPKSQCSQAIEMLKELFPNGFPNSGSLVSTFTAQKSIDQSQASTSANQKQTKSNSQIRPNQTTANSQRPAEDRSSLKEHKSGIKEYSNASYIQSPKPVAKEILKGISGLDISKTGPLSGKSSEVSGVLLVPRDDCQKPSPLITPKSQKATMLTLKQTNMPITKQSESCVCGEIGAQTSCGVFLCSNCLPLHAQCMVCSKVNAARKPSKEMQVHLLKEEQKNTEELKEKEGDARPKQERGIQGTMKCTELTISLPGYEQYRTAKITYLIPNGIQGEEHPNPGLPFQGGVLEAYLPLSSKGQGLLKCLEKAFKQGFTFTVCPSNNTGTAKITWSRIPHKTKITGGKSGNGYPDSTYLRDLSEALRTCGIEGV